jgi:HNH endonuclease
LTGGHNNLKTGVHIVPLFTCLQIIIYTELLAFFTKMCYNGFMIQLTVPKLKKACDEMLTPITKNKYPMCESGCGNKTQVGHHWIEKSRSANLRYNLDNLVGLCNFCHNKIHNNFRNNVVQGVDIANIIIRKRGVEWHEEMKRLQPIEIKVNRAFYESEFNRLSEIYNER